MFESTSKHKELAMAREETFTFLARGFEFKGILTFEGTVRIDGMVSGAIYSKGTVILGEHAVIEGNISAGTIVSGGTVNGNVAAAILVEQGYQVQGVTLQTWEPEDDATTSKKWQERGCCKVGIARFVAQQLDIPHLVLDIRERFRSAVVQDFIDGYVAGLTPNPCVRCNERVKFGCLMEAAWDVGADYVATGHYARLLPDDSGRPHLHKGGDSRKDQSYFLYRLNRAWLPRILFPVGGMCKEEVWPKAEAIGLPADEVKESQEICFVTKGDYRSFLEEQAPQAARPGPFVGTDGTVLGMHRGVPFYTPGQRRGLGLAAAQRLYVLRRNVASNTVVVGSEACP